LGDLQVPVEAIVKIHPAESTRDYEPLIREIKPAFGVAITKNDLMEHLAKAQVTVALYSSVVAEACFYRKPVLVYELPINDPCTLYGQIAPSRLFKTPAELKEKLRVITEALSQGEIDTSPEDRLFSIYFGKDFKPKRLIEAIVDE